MSFCNSFYKLLQSPLQFAILGTEGARRALSLPMKDVEDAFQVSAALAWGADFIITRNLEDYRYSPVAALSPSAFLNKLA